MKTLIALLFSSFIILTESNAQTIFELDPSQTMLMSGEGQGQDGAINPYYGQDSYAIIENMKESEFAVRIQKKGEIIKMIHITGMETKKVTLLAGQELYFDVPDKEAIKVKLDFEKMD